MKTGSPSRVRGCSCAWRPSPSGTRRPCRFRYILPLAWRTYAMNCSRSCTFFPHATRSGFTNSLVWKRGSAPLGRGKAPSPHNLASQIDFALCRFPQRLGFDQWRIHQVFAEEPNLQLAGAKHVAHHQVVCAGVAQFGRTLREFTAMGDDELVRVQQARQLHRKPANGTSYRDPEESWCRLTVG